MQYNRLSPSEPLSLFFGGALFLNKNLWVTMGDYGWSMNFDTSQGIVAVEYGRVLEYPKREIKSQTTRKPDLFR